MRTQRELYSEKRVVYECELEQCPKCGQQLTTAYTSGWKTVQTMSEVITLAQRPKRCTKRQTFSEVQTDLQASARISETQVRAIYHQRYLP